MLVNEKETSDIDVKDPELPRFDEFLKQTQEKRAKSEKNKEQLAEARDAKAKKAQERKADDDGDDAEDDKKLPQPDGELAELIDKKKASKKAGEEKIELKGKEPEPKEKAKPEPEPEPEPKAKKAEAEGEDEDEEEGEAKVPSKAFAALTRKEKALSEQQRALADKERTLAEQQRQFESHAREIQAKLKEAEARENKIRHDIEAARRAGPNSLLKAFGWTVADAVDEVSQDGSSPTALVKGVDYELRREIENVRRELLEERQRREEAERARAMAEEERTVNQYRDQMVSFVRQNQDDYELIILKGEEDRVFRTIEEHYEKYKVLPTFKDAADAVEAALYEEEKKVLSAKKFAANKPQSAPEVAPAKSETRQTREQKASTTTITDSLASAPAASDDDDDLMLGMDRDEALARLRKKRSRSK